MKKRKLEEARVPDDNISSEGSFVGSSEDEAGKGDEATGTMDVAMELPTELDLEPVMPTDYDLDQIKLILDELFVQSDQVDVSQLAEYIVAHSNLAIVLKQAIDEQTADDEDSDDIDPVLGVCALVTFNQPSNSASQLNQFLKSKCPKDLSRFSDLLIDKSKKIGFIINERLTCIGKEASIPVLKCLDNAIKKTLSSSSDPTPFTDFIVICKGSIAASGTSKTSDHSMTFANLEDECICSIADMKFEYDVILPESDDAVKVPDTNNGYTVASNVVADVAMNTEKMVNVVVVFCAEKLSTILNLVEGKVNSQ